MCCGISCSGRDEKGTQLVTCDRWPVRDPSSLRSSGQTPVPEIWLTLHPHPPVFLQVFILKDFKFSLFASVHSRGVTDAFYGSVHCKGLSGRQESSAGVAEESSAGAGAEGGSESGVASASFWFQESKP